MSHSPWPWEASQIGDWIGVAPLKTSPDPGPLGLPISREHKGIGSHGGTHFGQLPPKANLSLRSCFTILDFLNHNFGFSGDKAPPNLPSPTPFQGKTSLSPHGPAPVKSCKKNKGKKEVKREQRINCNTKDELEQHFWKVYGSRHQGS